MQNEKSIYGIIGNPIEHSLSPLLHNTAFSELGVDALYTLFPLKEEALESFFQDLRRRDCPIFGLNVTVPYKEKALRYMDSLSPLAQKIKAVNTIVISRDRTLKGFNTDGPGFLAHLAELRFDTTGKKIVILGAGGTARAIVTGLCLLPERPQSILIYNHHKEKAGLFVEDMRKEINVDFIEAVSSIDDLHVERTDLLVNTTPVGMKADDPTLVDQGLLHPNMLVYDVIYRPRQTPLLKMAQARGALTSNGLGMLFYQGVLAFAHWAQIPLDEKVKQKMRESLEAGLA